MKTIKRNLLWVIMLLLCFTIVNCKKEASYKSAKKMDTISQNSLIEIDTAQSDKSGIKKTVKILIPQIPDTLAVKYVKKYAEVFPNQDIFQRGFVMKQSSYNTILRESAVTKKIKLLLTENNGRLEIIYENPDGEKFLIFDLDNIDEAKYQKMANSFRSNCYEEMNKAINRLDNNLKENTREIIIPYEDFEKLKPENSSSLIVFLPGVITQDTLNENNMKNQKHHFTLIAFTTTLINERTGEIKPDMSVLYDNFCVNPPNNC